MNRQERVVLVGFGAIGSAVVRLLEQRGGLEQIAAIGLRETSHPHPHQRLPDGVPVLRGPEQLGNIDAGLVVEAAGRDSVASWGRAALGRGMNFAVSSISAFTDRALLAELSQLAKARAAQVILSPGAIGGIDALAAASRIGLDRVEHHIIKPPRAWVGTEAETLCDLVNLRSRATLFQGSAREAAMRFPQNANVALLVALAGLGPDATRVAMVADPDINGNRHEINATGGFGRMALQFDNAALAGNPKSSAMAALSIVRLIENAGASLVI